MEYEIDALRLRAAAVLRGLTHPPLGMAAALAEECGEVSKHLLDRYAYGKLLSTPELADELADVFLCLCEIATHHGCALGPAVDQKLTKLAALAPGWREQLGDALDRAGGGTLPPLSLAATALNPDEGQPVRAEPIRQGTPPLREA